MKTQKQSRIDLLSKKIEAQSRIIDYLLQEINNTKTMAIGTFKTIQEMPGYKKAINKLKENQNNVE